MISGNYIPKMSYEYAKGTIHPMPKTEKTFKKMIRILGYTFVISGVLIIAAIFCSNKIAFFTILGMCFIVFIESLYFSLKND